MPIFNGIFPLSSPSWKGVVLNVRGSSLACGVKLEISSLSVFKLCQPATLLSPSQLAKLDIGSYYKK
jgi:hypothetical protein